MLYGNKHEGQHREEDPDFVRIFEMVPKTQDDNALEKVMCDWIK
jgi:hypothetical protein